MLESVYALYPFGEPAVSRESTGRACNQNELAAQPVDPQRLRRYHAAGSLATAIGSCYGLGNEYNSFASPRRRSRHASQGRDFPQLRSVNLDRPFWETP